MDEAKAIGTSITTVQPWRYTPVSQKSVAIQGVSLSLYRPTIALPRRPRLLSTPYSRVSRSLDTVLAVGICFLLAFGPLAFGAVQPWSIWVLEMAVSFLFVIWAVRGVLNGGFHIAPNTLFIPMALFASVVWLRSHFI